MNKELRAKTNEELIDLVIKLKGQLLQYRFKLAHGELDKPHLIKETKKVLARIYTILTERKVNLNLLTKQNNLTKQSPEVIQLAEKARKQLQEERAKKREKSKAKRAANKKEKLSREVKLKAKQELKKHKATKKIQIKTTKKTTVKRISKIKTKKTSTKKKSTTKKSTTTKGRKKL